MYDMRHHELKECRTHTFIARDALAVGEDEEALRQIELAHVALNQATEAINQQRKVSTHE